MTVSRVWAAAGAVAVIGLLAGCGSSADAGSATAPTPTKKSKSAKAAPSPTPIPSVPASWSPAPSDKTVYLTFDDGPSPYTPQVLDILKANDAKATFFEIGKMIRTREKYKQMILDQGHVIGDHSWDHIDLNSVKGEKLDYQINRTAREIGPQMGPCMRPPYGAMNDSTRKVIVASGMTPVLWNRDTNDWNHASQSAIYNVLINTQPGDVILMHDGGGDRKNTVAALKEALPKLKDKGYKFGVVPVCQPLA